MISSAAASVTGSLALGPGAQAAPADDAAVSTDFAALLGSTVASDAGPEAAAGQGAATDNAAQLKQMIGKPTRQANGNAAGKKLPQELPDPADDLADTAKPADGAADDTADAVAALTPITTEIVLPGLVVPISMPLPQASTPATTPTSGAPASNAMLARTNGQPAIGRSTTDSLAQAAAAQAMRLPRPGSTETALAAKAGKTPAPAQQGEAQASAAPNPVSPAALQGTASAPISLAVKADGTPAVPAASADAVPVVALLPGSPTRADEVHVTIASPEQPAAIPTSTGAQLASAQAVGQVVGQGTDPTAAAAKTAAPKNGQSAATASVDPAKSNQVSIQTAATGPQPSAPAAPRGEAAAQEGTPASPDARHAQAKTASSESPGIPAEAPVAPAPPQMVGQQDGQSFSQATAPVTSASSVGSLGQTRHDFATLVDRLVEARDAASPASVHAAVTHSEFGQVSLRFNQDANGLSVAMSSADPDFARAVQASSAQSQMSGGNNSDRGSGAPRQDTSAQQQTAGSFSGQSQSQPQSSASGRGDRSSPTQTDSRTGRSSGRPTQDADTADTRGGIYA